MRGLIALVAGVLVSVGQSIAVAAPGDLLLSIPNPTPNVTNGEGSFFGTFLTTVGNKIAVSAVNDNVVHVFDGTTGNRLISISNPAPRFGIVAPMGDNSILVGADNWSGSVTTAYRYDLTTGSLQQSYENPAPAFRDEFSVGLAAVGNDVVVGANQHWSGGAGVAFKFNGTTGSLLYPIVPSPAPQTGDQFGVSVAADGDLLAIGAPQLATGGSGMVHLFSSSTGTFLSTIPSPTQLGGDFGRNIAVHGNKVLVGAPMDSTDGSNSGIAYLFDGSTGDLLQTFHNPSPHPGATFGDAVAFVGDNLLIGANYDTIDGINSAGSACLFDAGGNPLLTLHDPTPATSDEFGISVAALGNNLVVGAQEFGTPYGHVYVFQGVPEPSTLVLLTAGAISLLGYAWRRRRRAA